MKCVIREESASRLTMIDTKVSGQRLTQFSFDTVYCWSEPKMSESVATLDSHASDAPAVPDEPFDKGDISTFRSEDKEAGTNICKMLVAFFFYSLLAMAFVTWWAFGAMQDNTNPETPTATAGAHSSH
jgi:hypothetical protein